MIRTDDGQENKAEDKSRSFDRSWPKFVRRHLDDTMIENIVVEVELCDDSVV